METTELTNSTGFVGRDATVLHIDDKTLGGCGRCKDCARNAAVNLLDTHDDILIVEHTNFVRHIHDDGDELTTPSLGKAEIVIPGGINTVNSVARLIAVDCSFECIRAIQTVAELVGNDHFLGRTQPITRRILHRQHDAAGDHCRHIKSQCAGADSHVSFLDRQRTLWQICNRYTAVE